VGFKVQSNGSYAIVTSNSNNVLTFAGGWVGTQPATGAQFNVAPIPSVIWYNGTLWTVILAGTSGSVVPTWDNTKSVIYDGSIWWRQALPSSKQYFPIPQHAVNPAYTYPDNISIGGRPFTANTSYEQYRREAFRHRTIAPQRQSINFENVAGYGTLNTEGLWRRDQLDWSNGAGQQFLDRKQDSTASRFLSSKGVNPWVESQLTLLNDTVRRGQASSNTNFKAVTAGQQVWCIDGTSLYYYKNSWSSTPTGTVAITATPTLNDICSDGAYVYVATSSGIWSVDTTAATPTATQYAKCDGTTALPNYQIVLDNFAGASNTNLIHTNNTVPSTIQIGMPVSGGGLPTNTYVTGISNSAISLNNKLSTSITTNDLLTFTSQINYTVSAFTKVWVCNNVVVVAAKQSTGSSNCLFGFVNKPVAGAVPDASNVLMIHPNPNFTWTCATGGATQIYMGGSIANGNSSQGFIYRSSMTGSSVNSSVNQPFDLNYPIQTLPLETGEYPTCLYAYLNFIFVGTNLGVRMCQTLSVYDPSATQTGDLKAGPLAPNLLQPVSSPVYAIVGDGRFVYFGWNNYDTTSTGIGRMDLTQTIGGDTLSLAYASDLMVTGQGTINNLAVDPFNNTPLMSIIGKGAYSADLTKYVPSGYIDSGSITYGISDDKIPVKIDMSANINGSSGIGISLKLFDPTGPSIIVSPDNYKGIEIDIGGSARSERINTILTLYSASNNTATPTLYRYTLKSWPTAVTETVITPVLMFYKNVLSGAQVQHDDPYDNFWFLQQLIQSQTIVQYKEGPLSANVVVEAMDWLPNKLSDDYNQGFVGDCVVTLKTIGGYQYNATPTQ